MNDLKQRMLDACHGDWASNLSHIPRALADGVAEIDRITAERDGLRAAVEHARVRFECLMDEFAEGGGHTDEVLQVMSEVDAERMDRALAALTPSVPDADGAPADV